MTIVQSIQQAANKGWLTTEQTLKAIKPLTTSCRLRSVTSLLAPYAESHAWKPKAGSHQNFSALLNASSAKFKGEAIQKNDDERVSHFIAALAGMGKIIEGTGVVVRYGMAEKEQTFNNIAKKFVRDHFVKDAKSGKTWAESRRVDGVLISTAIDRQSYGSFFDNEVGVLNKLGVFKLVESYLSRVKSWNPSNSMVNSICYVSKARIEVVTYSAEHPSGAKVSGHLMYAVQPNVAKPEQQLLYHYEDILPELAAPGEDWVEVDAASVIKKLNVQSDPDALRNEWPSVYYKEN